MSRYDLMTPSRVLLQPREDIVARTPGDPIVAERKRKRTIGTVRSIVGSAPLVELTSSCTHAIEAAATVLGIGPGDEVIVPAFSFTSSANPFVLRGATVRFADVDLNTGNVDAESVAERSSPRTRAVLCVHYAGMACDLDALVSQASSAGWDLIEDAAHGLFGSFRNRPLGRVGTFGALSFHRTKNVSAVEGGALLVNDPNLVDRTVIALDKGTNRQEFAQGKAESYEWSGPGSGWRMSDLAVAALETQLDRWRFIQERRHLLWKYYDQSLTNWAERVGAVLVRPSSHAEHPAHIFAIVLPPRADRREFVRWCDAREVEVARHYGSLPESRFGFSIADPRDLCPNAAFLSRSLVRLPLHHLISDDDAARVVDAVTTAPIGA